MKDARALGRITLPDWDQQSPLSVLILNIAHDNEHYGNIVTYLRLARLRAPFESAAQVIGRRSEVAAVLLTACDASAESSERLWLRQTNRDREGHGKHTISRWQREANGMFRHSISFRTRLFVCVFAVLALDTLGVTDLRAQGAVAARFDKAVLSKDVEALLKEHGEGIVANLWVGGDSGNPWFELSSDQPSATASAIKTFYLVELFAAHPKTLDNPLPGADAVLKDNGHSAISHFSSEQRAEIRRALGGASVRRVAEIMMGKANASNAVYNAAANLTTAVLGGPEMLTKLIRNRDPAFKEVSVRRYMLRDRKNPGDNEAPARALAALYQRLAARALAGIDSETMRAIREAIIKEDFDNRGVRFSKDGSLASDPLTEVRAGWWETAGGPVIYVIMMRESTLGPTPSSAQRLRKTVDTLTARLVGAGLASR